jgi:hypothetical protein
MSTQKSLKVIDMISWVGDYLKKDGYTIYNRYDKEPGIPIHLFCIKNDRKKIKESLVVLVTSDKEISEDYFNKLCFFQSYLSLYEGSDELKLILAIPDNAKIKKEEFSNRGFGLLKVITPINKEPAKLEYDLKPKTLRSCMEDDFKDKFPKIEVEGKDITRLFNKYIENAVVGIAGKNTVKFEERNIDRKLLDHLNNITSLPFALDLQLIANNYLNYEKDDYSFAMEWTKKLWNKYFQIQYPNIHEKLEPMLKELYPEYRDHFLHQFQVFLIGSIIIDKLIASGKINFDIDLLSKGWLLASTFHDFAQAVQKYDDWNKTFFKESLKIDVLEALELKKYYVENAFMSYMEHIISSLAKCYCNFEDQDRINNYNNIRHFFYHQITDKKNHGLLSSLSLLKRFETIIEFNELILPSAAAIAIHDDSIWQAMSGLLANSNEKDWIANLCTLKPISRLKLDIQPLAFLLILCDNIQDWGRHFGEVKLEESFNSAFIGLKCISLDKDRIIIQIFVDVNNNSLNYLKYKIDNLKLIKAFLQSSSPHFKIEFWDRERNEKTNFEVEIGD